MIYDQSYRNAFYAAIFIHILLAVLLLMEPDHQRPVMTAAKNQPSQALPVEQNKQPKDQVVKAVSVDNQEVMEAVNRLKQERADQLKAEQARQQALAKQAEMARKARLREQQQLAKLKEEAEKVAIARKKQMEEEQRRLRQLTLQKEQEAKRLAELKAKQQQLEKKQREETEKIAQLKKKQAEEKARAEKEKVFKEELARAEKAKAAEIAEKQRQAAAQQAAQDAAKKAHIAGEVDKYKAMIVNAISRQWILPENVNRGLSSQFRIRLAPDGAVLEVTLTRSSGDPVLDRSAQTAIYKASPLPVPTDADAFNIFRDISLTVRPENVRG
ncbi:MULTISPECIES: cell envelope integrity protein TolA [unclassified Legionella]|uniref:cell envelope integrity protein TolA n=1 Tax=unclassified Legionella TaxID=2622702 RepID=UPI001055FBE5|nr:MULTISPECIES: cell envelope integrity protein TolA [unclassified Legionella]MDI9819460.1 cell envelope integrity protein TolA [Legionella sp. PL877]